MFFLHFSEDYYGDLDLKGIKKSELHLGLSKAHSGNSNSNNNNTPPPAKSTSSKPRLSSSNIAQTRPQPNALPAQRPNQLNPKETLYDEENI